MDWRNESIWELRNLEAKRASIKDLQTQIREFDLRMTAIRSATSDGTPVSGGGSGREDMLLNCITERDLAEATMNVTLMQVDMIERALAFLSREEQEMLNLCYIHVKPGGMGAVCDRLQCDLSTVYRRRNRALRAYTLRRRGLESI